MNRRLLNGLIERTRRQYGEAYADFLVVLPHLEKAAERLPEFERHPYDSLTRGNIVALIEHLRVFFPIVTPSIGDELKAPTKSDSEDELHHSLVEHITLLLSWARFEEQGCVAQKKSRLQRFWDWLAALAHPGKN